MSRATVLTLAPAEELQHEIALAEHAAVIRALGKRVIGDVIEIGRRLAAAKGLAEKQGGHARWVQWIDQEFGWDEKTARNLLNVHAFVEKKSGNFPDLPVSGLYLLAAPSTPEEVRQQVIERAENGERLSVKHVKELIDEARNKQK